MTYLSAQNRHLGYSSVRDKGAKENYEIMRSSLRGHCAMTIAHEVIGPPSLELVTRYPLLLIGRRSTGKGHSLPYVAGSWHHMMYDI